MKDKISSKFVAAVTSLANKKKESSNKKAPSGIYGPQSSVEATASSEDKVWSLSWILFTIG